MSSNCPKDRSQLRRSTCRIHSAPHRAETVFVGMSLVQEETAMGASPPTRIIFLHVRCQLTPCIDRLGLSEVVLPAAFQEITVKARQPHKASSAAD
jgi:hypothetical protein